MRKLNGWQRVGVVLSIIWLPLGFLYGSGQAVDSATWAVTNRLRMCYAADGVDYSACHDAFEKDWAVALSNSHHWLWGAVTAILPALFCWFLIWGLVRVVRWVAAGGFGFRQK